MSSGVNGIARPLITCRVGYRPADAESAGDVGRLLLDLPILTTSLIHFLLKRLTERDP